MRPACFTAAVVVTVLSACSSASVPVQVIKTPTPSNANEVVIYEYTFRPETLTVSVGATVTWVNRDMALHTATHRTFGAEPFDSERMPVNATFEHKFRTAGSYDYLCIYHGGMRGRIVVQ